MEYYLLTHGSEADVVFIEPFLESGTELPVEFRKEIFIKYAAHFWFSTVTQLHSVNQKCTAALIFLGVTGRI